MHCCFVVVFFKSGCGTISGFETVYTFLIITGINFHYISYRWLFKQTGNRKSSCNQTTNQNVNFNATIKLESNNPSLDLSEMEDRISKTVSNMFLNAKGSIDGNNTSKSNSVMIGGGSL